MNKQNYFYAQNVCAVKDVYIRLVYHVFCSLLKGIETLGYLPPLSQKIRPQMTCISTSLS